MPDRATRRRPAGVRTRAHILETAGQLASVQGLDGLSIKELADAVGMSKSGLYAHFESKQDLQLATIEAAREGFIDSVVAGALEADAGTDRLVAACDGFLRYVEQRVFAGGCFFVSAAAEFGPRSGPVTDRVAEAQQQWTEFLRGLAEQSQDRGQLDAQADPAALAFELSALLAGTNVAHVLHEDPAILENARAGVRRMIDARRPPDG